MKFDKSFALLLVVTLCITALGLFGSGDHIAGAALSFLSVILLKPRF